MSIRGLIIALLVAALLGLAWQQRGPLQAWLEGSASQVKRLSAAPAERGSTTAEPNSLRKCVKGGEVTYSNVDCPAGAQVKPVTGGTVSVVAAPPSPKPSEAASGPTALHKALDITRDDTLRDKIMQRQIEGPR